MKHSSQVHYPGLISCLNMALELRLKRQPVHQNSVGLKTPKPGVSKDFSRFLNSISSKIYGWNFVIEILVNSFHFRGQTMKKIDVCSSDPKPDLSKTPENDFVEEFSGIQTDFPRCCRLDFFRKKVFRKLLGLFLLKLFSIKLHSVSFLRSEPR